MKRLIVTLLAVCMVVGMFAGLTVTASADYDTSDMVAYTMTAGDNVYNVCQKMGISFWDYESVIKTVNNITSYSAIKVGAVIYFPKPGSSTTISSSSSSSGSSSTSGSTTASTDSFTVKSDDKIAYYLIPHVMQSGETIKDVCSTYGIDYYSYSAKIAKINGLKSCDYIKAGVTVLIPSISAPSGECYRVISHTVQAGDSVYNKCIEYGVSYYGSLTVLKGVNNTDNLSNIKVGATLYIPVLGTAGGSSGTGTGTGTGSSSGSTSSTTGVVYNITIAEVEHGKVSANVNDAAVVKAASGAAVVISATPDKGYALDSFSVAATSGGAAVLSTDEGFTMPAFAVTVTPVFRQASSYKATASTAQHGTVKLQPAGGTAAQSQQITEGTKVTVVTTADKGYTLDSIKVYNPNNTKKTVEVNGNTFIMPSHAVAVEVTFMSSETYTVFTRKSVVNGSYWIEVDGVKATEVNKGKTVTVCVDPSVGYEVKNVHYYETADEGTIKNLGTSQTFVMPDCDVTVVVEFQKGTAHAVSVTAPANGTVKVSPASALCGETVSLTATPDKGYKLDSITVKDANGMEITVNDDNTFTMPSTNVTVEAVFKKGNYNITLNTGANGTAKVLVNGAEVKTLKANAGDNVMVKATPKPGYVAKVTATNLNGNKEYVVNYDSVNDWYYLKDTMPANAVIFNVTFELPTYTVTGPSVTGSGTAALLKDGEKLDPAKAAKGDIITISVEPAPGCSVKTVEVTDAIVTKVNDLTYTFKMPAKDVDVKVEFASPEVYNIKLDASLTGGKISFVVDGYPATTASKGDTVQMVITPDDGKELKNVQVTKNGDATKVTAISGNSFTMPGYDVDVTAAFVDVKATSYKITKSATTNGSFLVLAKSTDTKDTLTAAKGTEMLIKVSPKTGYVVDEIKVTYNNGISEVSYISVDINIWKFAMVDADVTVSVTYKAA